VELLNMRFRKRQKPVHLHGPEEQLERASAAAGPAP